MDLKRYFLIAFALVALVQFSHFVQAEDWPQWLGTQRDGVWREEGLMESLPSKGLKAIWRVPVGGGYSGPSIQNGKVFITDRILEKGATNPSNPFAKSNSKGVERLLCLNETTGKTEWEHSWPSVYQISYPSGPRATPLADGDRVLALGAMGDLVCVGIGTGKVIWQRNLPKDFATTIPIWGFAAHPMRYKDTYICLVGGKGSVVVAFDRQTGKEIWKSGTLENPANEIGYCPPVMFEIGGMKQLIVWHTEALVGLDPDTGVKLWSVPFKLKANLAISVPRQTGNRILVSSFYNGSMLVEAGHVGNSMSPKIVWKGEGRGERPDQTKSLNSIMSNAWVDNGTIYGVCSYGELRGLELETGKRLWADLKATSSVGKVPAQPEERWANAFIIPLTDPKWKEKYLLFNEKGDLIQAKLTPRGYEELGRVKVIEPTGSSGMGNRAIVWSHPALANQAILLRNDKEIVRYDFSGNR